ncbi:MAG: hypothetical protein ABSE51_19925 [Terracidiphilus sp.]|jgi:hypothetical protein
MKLATLAFVLALASVLAVAQTNPVATVPGGFVASSDALAINCGTWGAGNLTTESYDLVDYGATKSNRVFVQGVELSAPNCGLSVYGGGLLWQPDITKLLAKTNLPSGNFLVFFDANAGDGMPTTGSNRVSAVMGGGLKYILSDNLTWNTIRFEETFFGSQRYPAVSMGIAGYFGGTPASPAISSNVKSGLIRRAARAAHLVQ